MWEQRAKRRLYRADNRRSVVGCCLSVSPSATGQAAAAGVRQDGGLVVACRAGTVVTPRDTSFGGPATRSAAGVCASANALPLGAHRPPRPTATARKFPQRRHPNVGGCLKVSPMWHVVAGRSRIETATGSVAFSCGWGLAGLGVKYWQARARVPGLSRIAKLSASVFCGQLAAQPLAGAHAVQRHVRHGEWCVGDQAVCAVGRVMVAAAQCTPRLVGQNSLQDACVHPL